MALAGTVQPATAAMLLLALLLGAAAVSPSDAANQPANGMAKKIATRRYGHHGDGKDNDQLPLMTGGLTRCVGACGTEMTTCLLGCYQPLVRADPVALPYCLLSCSNNVTLCVGYCAGTAGDLNY